MCSISAKSGKITLWQNDKQWFYITLLKYLSVHLPKHVFLCFLYNSKSIVFNVYEHFLGTQQGTEDTELRKLSLCPRGILVYISVFFKYWVL